MLQKSRQLAAAEQPESGWKQLTGLKDLGSITCQGALKEQLPTFMKIFKKSVIEHCFGQEHRRAEKMGIASGVATHGMDTKEQKNAEKYPW